MTAIHKIIPVKEYDLAGSLVILAKRIVSFAKDPEEAAHLDLDFLEQCVTVGARVQQEIAELTETARRGSRWATHAELPKAIRATGARMKCDEITITGTSGALLTHGKRKHTVKWALGVHALVEDDRETFYCEGDAELVHALADELARVAGPQMAFSEHDLFDPDSIHLATGQPATGRAKDGKRRTA